MKGDIQRNCKISSNLNVKPQKQNHFQKTYHQTQQDINSFIILATWKELYRFKINLSSL